MNPLVTKARALCRSRYPHGIWYRSSEERAKTLLPEMAAEIERLEKELDALKSDIEAGRLVRLPNELIAPYELNERYWVCGWNSDDCTMTIQDRVMKREAAMKEDSHDTDTPHP